MRTDPRHIPDCWDEGFALDLHTLESEFIGYDEYGHAQFDTRRSELGDLIYRLKYRGETSVVPTIAQAVCDFVRAWKPGVDVLVPVPPSRNRPVQPLFSIAEESGRLLSLPVDKESVRKVRDIPELKNVYDYAKRLELLEGAHGMQGTALRGRRVLLLDDLFRSGATLNAIAQLLRSEGGVTAIFALALTRTRTAS